MTCRDLIEFLGRYFQNELAPEERFRFDAHLAICPECVAYLRNYATTVEIEKQALRDPDGGVPAEVPEDLVRAILTACGPRKG